MTGKHAITIAIILPAVAFTWAVSPWCLKADEPAVRLGLRSAPVDLSGVDWEYFSTELGADIALSEAVQAAKGTSIRVGRRWQLVGHAELNGRSTWLKLAFFVPAEMKGRKIGFFCTAVDDKAGFFVNGVSLGNVEYHWGYRVHAPTDIDLTPAVRYGEKNELLIRVDDTSGARGVGILGNVCIYQTLPFKRTQCGGIQPAVETAEKLSVVLHLGDAILARGDQTAFTPDELARLDIPPYILREDELILIVPSAEADSLESAHLVQLDNVSPTNDARPLAVSMSPSPVRIERYALMEIPLDVNGTYDNPFNPLEINVQAVVETPTGHVEKVPAFFRQDFTPVDISDDEEILLPKKSAPWKLYYRPRQAGKHRIQVFATDKSGMAQSVEHSFEVVPSERRGFLRVSRRDPRLFEFDNGESFFGIGPSGWFRDENFLSGGNTRRLTTRRSDGYYERKAANHSTFEYCLAEFYGRLYTAGGFIDQHVAWKTEHRLRTLERLGIYWIVVYDDIRRAICYGFDTMPYSLAQGGPCREVKEVYADERALRMQKDQLRYFIARMADSPALWIWTCGDEGQPGPKNLVRSWLKELHGYIRQNDIYAHPHIYGENEDCLLYGDGVLVHDWYYHRNKRFPTGAHCDGNYADTIALTACLDKQFGRPDRPIVIPEGGPCEWALGWHDGLEWNLPEAIPMHNHLWISLFLKHAGGGTEWLANMMDEKKQLYHAAAMHNYLQGESLTAAPFEIALPTVSDEKLRAFALKSEDKTLVWVQNRDYTWYRVSQSKEPVETVSGAQLVAPVAKNGEYRIELWDTRDGRIVSQTTSNSNNKQVDYSLPAIDKDVALKFVFVSDDK